MSVRIVKLQAENIKRIQAVEITPDKDLVIVAGQNAQGKSSVLDAITYALGGKDAVPAEPIRDGAKFGKVTIDCGDFIATREFSPSGQKLILKSKEGVPIARPQDFLDGLLSKLSFDPLEFSRMKADARIKTLLSLTEGLDDKLTDIDRRRATAFEKRKEYNASVKTYNGQLAGMEAPKPDWPQGEVCLDTFTEKRRQLQAVIDKNNQERNDLKTLTDEVVSRRNKVAELARQLEDAKTLLHEAESSADSQSVVAHNLADPDISSVDTELNAAIEQNKLAAKRQQFEKVFKAKSDAEAWADKFTEQIASYDREKETTLASAVLPIPGLAFADGDVRYNGQLFDQLALSEQLRVSLSMGMAANPKLHVILVKDASLLDEGNMAIARQMAKEKDYQIWMECVGERGDATVIIEDGKVKEHVNPSTN
jgi:DNA repair ATPase RecN